MKPWWKSKTLWLNALAAALVAVELNLHLLQGTAQPAVYLVLAGVLAAANIVLRSVTTQPVGRPGARGGES